MHKNVKIALAVIGVLAYGQANFIVGYDNGADTMLCLQSNINNGNKLDHPSCKRVWKDSPMIHGVAAWRILTNDQIKTSPAK